MATEEGTVTRVKDNRAWVTVKRSTMCEECQSKGACHSLGGGKDMEAEALNIAGGKIGDLVLIKIKSKSLLKLTFLVYMIPAIALISGAIIGRNIAISYSYNSELFSVLSSIVLFIISIIAIIIIGNYLKGKRSYMPEVIKIIYRTTLQ